MTNSGHIVRLVALCAVVLTFMALPRFAAAHEARQKRVRRLLTDARRLVGTPYLWGGTTPRGFDCSGFVQYVFGLIGIHLPRTTWSQMYRGERIKRWQIKPGDALFFWDGNHVAIYLGRGLVEDAPHSGSRVGVRKLAAYASGFFTARRYISWQ